MDDPIKVLVQFIIGAIGALITVYARSRVAVPEMRAIFDIAPLEKRVDGLDKRIEKETGELDRIRRSFEVEQSSNVKKPQWTADEFRALETSYRGELDKDQRTRAEAGRTLDRYRAVHRVLGFATYVLLGGAFAALFGSLIKVEGLSDELRTVATPLVLGGTWTSYLSVVGFDSVKSEAVTAAGSAADKLVERKLAESGAGALPAGTPDASYNKLVADIAERLRSSAQETPGMSIFTTPVVASARAALSDADRATLRSEVRDRIRAL